MGHKPVSPYEFPLCTLQVAFTNRHCRITTHKLHVRSTQLGVCLALTHWKVSSHKESPQPQKRQYCILLSRKKKVYRAMSNILGLNFEKFIGAWQYKFENRIFFIVNFVAALCPKTCTVRNLYLIGQVTKCSPDVEHRHLIPRQHRLWGPRCSRCEGAVNYY